MLLSSLVLVLVAQSPFPASAPGGSLPALQGSAQSRDEPARDDPPRPYSQLETMSRMLQKQLEARREPILGAADAATTRFVGSDGSVTNALLGAYATPSVSFRHAEYVPGLAAIFSLTVHARTEVVDEAPKPATDESEVPASRNADDEAWDSVARGSGSHGLFGSWRDGTRIASGDAARSLATRRQRFDEDALDAIESTLLDTIWRFGHKLDLSRGERLAVVVTIHPAHPARAAASSQAAADPAADERQLALDSYGRATTFFDQGRLTSFGTYAPAAARRLVIQVGAEDLAAYRSGGLERDDLRKRTRLQSFAGPETSGGSFYSSQQAK